MNTYENIIIFDASLSDEDFNSAKDRILKLVTGAEGKILKEDIWGLKRLAYEINKHSKGNYVRLIFTAPPSLIKTMEDLYKVFDPVIKYMFIRLEKKQLIALETELRAAEKSAAEADKKSAEAEKPAAEAGKEPAEADKKSAEAEKPAAEADKKSAEAEKPAAEAGKKSAEAEKPAAEAAKESAEAEKPAAEAAKEPAAEGDEKEPSGETKNV